MRSRRKGRLALSLAGTVLVAAGCGDEPAPTPPYPPGPVVVLAFDGLDPDRVREYENAGNLPNFARLRERAAVGRVRSTIPMNAATSWTTVATGVRPGEHGIWGFGWDTEDGSRFATPADRLAPAIWTELASLGRTARVFGMPLTSSADSAHGVLAGRSPAITSAPATGREDEWLADLRRARDADLGAAIVHGRASPRPDLTLVVFSSPALVQRFFLGGSDPAFERAVRDEYVWCDEVLGRFLDDLGEGGTLLVCSNRGFGAARWAVSRAACAALPDGVRVGARPSSFEDGGFTVDTAASPADVDAFRAALEALEHGGERCFRAVHDLRTRDLRGHAAHLGPVLVPEPADGFTTVPGDLEAPLVAELVGPIRARARRDGYFAIAGPFVEVGPVRDLDLADVPAIVMHRVGEPIPRRYVHNVPRRLFPLDYFVLRPMKFSGTPNDELRAPSASDGPLDEAVAATVRGLGYVR